MITNPTFLPRAEALGELLLGRKAEEGRQAVTADAQLLTDTVRQLQDVTAAVEGRRSRWPDVDRMLMHPGVGRALAELLRECANADQYDSWVRIQKSALAVARALRGDQP